MGSKTKEVQQLILDEILDGKYDADNRLPSEREMSEKLKLSRVTVRRAYDQLEKNGIILRKDRSGSYINTSYAVNTQSPKIVAVLASLNDFFALEFVDALERTLRLSDISLVIRQTDKDPGIEKKVAIGLVQGGITNLIVWASGDGYDSLCFSRLRMMGINLVFFDRMVPGGFADYVGSDSEHGIHLMMKDALKRGARAFLFIGYRDVGWSSFQQRELAFFRYCERARLSYKMEKIQWSDRATHVMDDISRDFMQELRESPSYSEIEKCLDGLNMRDDTAVICVNDYIALQVKRIAPHVLVYGFDGLPEAVRAGVISYRHSMRKMAQEAIRLLLSQQELSVAWKPRVCFCRGALIGVTS